MTTNAEPVPGTAQADETGEAVATADATTTEASSVEAASQRATGLADRLKLNRRPILAGFAAGALVLGVVWAGTAGLFGGTFTLEGAMTLQQSSSYGSYSSYSSYGSSSYSSSAYSVGSDGSCMGDGGYSDISAGTAVNVYDSSGAVVAVGELSRGRGSYSSGCTFSFSVPDVPTGERFYQVEISHRGKMNLTADEAEAGTAAYSLGGS